MKNLERILAQKARRNLGIGEIEPINDLEAILRYRAKISIIKKKLKGKISGMCSKKFDVAAIVINSTYSLGRQNFTLAHEYYHILHDNDFSKQSDIKEKSANKFASFFLMPKEALEYQLMERKIEKKDQIDIKDVLYFSNFFQISYLAVLVRLRYEEKLITKAKFDELKDCNARDEALKHGFPEELYNSTNEEGKILSDYVEEAQLAHKNNKITDGKYEEVLIEGGFIDIVFGLDEGSDVKDGNIEDYI